MFISYLQVVISIFRVVAINFSCHLALKIHISQNCKEALDKLQGYEIVERGPMTIKVCMKMVVVVSF